MINTLERERRRCRKPPSAADVKGLCAQHLHPGADIATLAQQIPVQLELGIPSDLVPIATQTGE